MTVSSLNSEYKYVVRFILPDSVFLRACANDVPKIKIGENQNQNWALIGRGSKTS